VLNCRLPEQPLAPADNCVFKSKANHEELAFATASPASKGPAVSSQHWPASPLRSKSSAPPRNTSVSGIKEPSSYSGSAQSVGLPSSTPKKVTMSLWASPWVRLLTRTFRHLKFPSTTAVGTRGFSCRQARESSTRIPLDQKPRARFAILRSRRAGHTCGRPLKLIVSCDGERSMQSGPIRCTSPNRPPCQLTERTRRSLGASERRR
jgi:hypothetical protein